MQSSSPNIDYTQTLKYSDASISENGKGIKLAKIKWMEPEILAKPNTTRLINIGLSFNTFMEAKDKLISLIGRQSNIDTQVEQILVKYPFVNIEFSQIQNIKKHIFISRIKTVDISEHIAQSQAYMTVNTIQLQLINDKSNNEALLYLSINADGTTKPSSEQFDEYITGYLANIDVAKSKIHISVV